MAGNFSYSFNRETFLGNYETRQEALKEAIKKLSLQDRSVETIYIGKRQPIDPAIVGVGEMILAAIRRRVRDELGDTASQSLRSIDEHHLADLDAEVNNTIRAWVSEHGLLPELSKISAISEHLAPAMAKAGGNFGE
jgi:hypothetical protein